MCGVKRAYNPQMSRVFETRRHRRPSDFPKYSSYVPVEMEDVEVYLNEIMDDIDTILKDWNLVNDINSIRLALNDGEAVRANRIHEILGMNTSNF